MWCFYAWRECEKCKTLHRDMMMKIVILEKDNGRHNWCKKCVRKYNKDKRKEVSNEIK